MKILKNVYVFVILALVLICAILFVDFLRAPTVTVSQPSPNYVVYSTISNENGKFEKMLTYNTNYDGLGINNEKSKQIQSKLAQKIQNLVEDEKRFLKGHDANLTDVEFLIINEGGIAGYVVSFASYDVYVAYYNSLHREIKKGAFVDKITQKTKYPLTIEDEKRYKEMMIETVAEVDIDISNSYKPTFYYEYVSPNSRGRANAHQIQQDSMDYTHYIWLSEKTDRTQDLIIKINKINYWVWIVVGLFAPLGIMFLTIEIITFNKKNTKIIK